MSSKFSFNVNDIVVCKVIAGKIVNSYEENYEYTVSIKIIGVRENKYEADDFVAYIPDYELARIETIQKIDHFMCYEFGIHKKFLGDFFVEIKPKHILTKSYAADGLNCKRCQEYFAMSESNNDDGSFTCRSCRLNPWI